MDHATCYRALTARDPRFDGLFFVGVTSTRIYCRPICPARTPRADHCRFFRSAALAEQQGFRPCLRCRPELAPGLAPVDAVARMARLAAARIEGGALNDGGSLESLADELGLSSRQLRRVLRQEFGVSPVELAQTCRLLLAKQLITESGLPIVQVAFASGFQSVRRFNALFHKHYQLTPSKMRRARLSQNPREGLRLTLGYRPPFALQELLRFLAARAIPRVECGTEDSYVRTMALGKHAGWIAVSPIVGKNALSVRVATTLAPVLPAVLGRVRALFDLSARPDVIDGQLAADPNLRPLIQRHPGLRVPGAFDGFELAVRAVLGQRISVSAATTLAGRLTARFGTSVTTPWNCLAWLFPDADRLADADTQKWADLGIPAARVACLRALARCVADGHVRLEPCSDPTEPLARLREIPGIGVWTAEYIALRALRWPDAFPDGDLGLRKAWSGNKAPLVKAAEAWRPWRAYAAVHLWQSLHKETSP